MRKIRLARLMIFYIRVPQNPPGIKSSIDLASRDLEIIVLRNLATSDRDSSPHERESQWNFIARVIKYGRKKFYIYFSKRETSCLNKRNQERRKSARVSARRVESIYYNSVRKEKNIVLSLSRDYTRTSIVKLVHFP